MSSVHNKHIVETCYAAAQSSAARGRWVSGRKKYEWQRQSVAKTKRVVEWDTQRAQWDSWSRCHFSAKVGFISRGAKLVFIGSLGVRDLWGSWEERGTTEGGQCMICQQTTALTIHMHSRPLKSMPAAEGLIITLWQVRLHRLALVAGGKGVILTPLRSISCIWLLRLLQLLPSVYKQKLLLFFLVSVAAWLLGWQSLLHTRARF